MIEKRRPMQILAWLLLAGLLVAMSAAGCTTAPPKQLSSGTLHGGFLGLQGQVHAFWEEWTPREPAQMAVSDEGDSLVVFDAWSLEDRDMREILWDSTFHVMLAAKSVLPDGADTEGLTSLMMRLGIDDDEARFEVAFFSRQAGDGEGMVLRIVEPDGAGVWVEAERRKRSSDDPIRWTLRVEPAFEEAPGMAIWWERVDGAWTGNYAPGAGAISSAEIDLVELPGHIVDWAETLELWRLGLWENATARAYVEPPFERIAVDEGGYLAPGWPVAMGFTVEPRGLDDLASDTVFWPRMTDDELQGR